MDLLFSLLTFMMGRGRTLAVDLARRPARMLKLPH
jgi:hypothetical protein